ncbi:MAG: LPS export ABC transporter periplasmic protein LptC [Desulfobacterales bacterium]|nr:LPS export ABC transporter periplasmic protein LptC [Desulfobacterales bacterium]
MMAPKVIKRVLLIVMLLGFTGVVGTFITYRKSFDNPGKISSLLPENTQVAMQSFEHTASRDGKTQWHLEAESASLMGKKKLVLKTPAVVFYRESGRKIYLTAESGVLNQKTNNITMSGNVVAQTGGYRFEADSAVYDHNRRFLNSKTPVKIIGKLGELVADTMTYDLGTNKATFSGNVKGVFSEQIS